MDIKFTKSGMELEKELNSLDNLVMDFTAVLNGLKIKYVLVSGYVSILFGRSRTSEDIDLIVEKPDFPRFHGLWQEIYKGFECIIEDDVREAYNEYLLTGHSIRFSRKGKFIPNVEFKFPKAELDYWTLKERKEVLVNGKRIFISPIELQIPYKLFLGSEKDIEDARHLYRLFKDKIDTKVLEDFNRKLNVENLFRRHLL